MHLKRILIGTDGSPTSRRAVAEGLTLAKALGSAITLVSVLHDVPPTFESAAEGPSGPAMSVINDAIAEAEQLGIEADYQILTGDAAEQITRFGHDRDVDLIVVGSRGLGSVAGALLGSVSHGVLRHADRTVMVVKERSAV